MLTKQITFYRLRFTYSNIKISKNDEKTILQYAILNKTLMMAGCTVINSYLY